MSSPAPQAGNGVADRTRPARRAPEWAYASVLKAKLAHLPCLGGPFILGLSIRPAPK